MAHSGFAELPRAHATTVPNNINTMRNKHKDGDLISKKERNWSLNRPSAETQALLRVAANVVTFGAAISAISAAKVCLETGHSQKRII